MAALLDFSIDALKYADAVDIAKSRTITKSLSDRIKTAFKTDSASPSYENDTSIPKGILPTDYKTFLILQDFLQHSNSEGCDRPSYRHCPRRRYALHK